MAFYSVRNVYKNFGKTAVLKGINFELEKGQVLAIIGSSGSGKTTLLRCINFLETPDKAEYFLNNENIFSINAEDKIDTTANLSYNSNSDYNRGNKQSSKRKKRKTINIKLNKKSCKNTVKQQLKFGMVFQSFNLFPHYNVKKNVTLAAKLQYNKLNGNFFSTLFSRSARQKRKAELNEINSKAAEILRRVGLENKQNAYPCELSGGQQQRVAIARALILQPEILCFDEPTSALDPELTREVLKVIKDIKSDDRTMIVVTHEMEFAKKVADKVIFMADGNIEEQGTPQQIFDNPQSAKTKAFLQEYEKNSEEENI